MGGKKNPSVTALPCHLSLRLGHGAALTCHRHVIHYRTAATLPSRGRLYGQIIIDIFGKCGIIELQRKLNNTLP